MELLATILAIALIAVIWWAVSLRRALAQQVLPPPAAPVESFQPLFDATTSAIDAGLIILDGEHRVRYLNPQAEELLGITTAVQPGQSLIALLRDYQVDTLVGEVLRDDEPREQVLQPVPYGRTLRLRATKIRSDRMSGVTLLIRDVTQLNMLERARRDMVANVSHELRTPLASVKLLVETLQSEPPPEVTKRMLSQMAQEVDAVTQLVDELHELSQIESGRVALQLIPTALGPVVLRAIERLHPQTERKSLKIESLVSDQLPLVLMDAARVGQVLINFLHNAAKFTPEGGSITIDAFEITVTEGDRQTGYIERRISQTGSISPEEEQRTTQPSSPKNRPQITIPAGHAAGDWMLIQISDTGIGIPHNDLPRIFERFYKVDRARTRNSGGTGLGLAIAKHLIEGHSGRVWASSREGVGSTFFFTLPVA